MKVIDGGKDDFKDNEESSNDKSVKGEIVNISDFVNPWEYEPVFDFEVCNRIKDLARCAPKRAVKLAIFGSKDFTDEEQKEFDSYYDEGSAEGEIAIGVKLFSQAMNGDNKAINQYLTMKAHWDEESSDEDDEESGLNIFLSDGNKK